MALAPTTAATNNHQHNACSLPNAGQCPMPVDSLIESPLSQQRRKLFSSTVRAMVTTIGLLPVTPVDAVEPTRLTFMTSPTTGVQWADMPSSAVATGAAKKETSQNGPPAATKSQGAVVLANSKVNVHLTGRLLGKNGWVFMNSQTAMEGDEPYRLQLGTGSVVPGLEEGLVGMSAGGRRRIVVPSSQGYLTKALEPIPRDFGNRQRLYGTVMNAVRIEREQSQLGSDLAGKVVFDVEVLRIR